jgi:hypothetical protein
MSKCQLKFRKPVLYYVALTAMIVAFIAVFIQATLAA